MRKSVWTIALALSAILAPTALRASDITYTVNQTVGAGSVTGFITTDGTIGTLGTADIVNWDLTLNDGTNPVFVLLGPTSGNNSGEEIAGADLTASATQLLYNFNASDNGVFIIESPRLGLNVPAVCCTSSSAVRIL